MRTTRIALLVAVFAGLTTLMPMSANAEQDVPANVSPAACGANDTPEPGIQGEVPRGSTPAWECGIEIVGSLLGASGPLTVAGDCAYTGGSAGVNVIDIREPQAPRLEKVLPTDTRENISAVITDDRAVLATRRRDTERQPDQVAGRDVLVDVWDIANCLDPQLKATLRYPTLSKTHGDPVGPAELGGPAHNVLIDPSGTKVYGTMPYQMADISDWANPSSWKVYDLQCRLASQVHPAYSGPLAPLCDATEGVTWRHPSLGHEIEFNKANDRIYAGGLTENPEDNELMILDTSDPFNPTVISQMPNSPGHSIDRANIGGVPYLLHAAEISGPATTCVPGQPRPTSVGFGDRAFLTDISDERAPVRVATIELAINKSENCATALASGSAGVHYHAVDDRDDTTFAMISWSSAGLRFIDLRQPSNPTEVAYFNYGSIGTDPIYDPATGLVYTSGGGRFWVLRLEDDVRETLGLDP